MVLSARHWLRAGGKSMAAVWIPELLRVMCRQVAWVGGHWVRRGVIWDRFHAQLWGRPRLTQMWEGLSRKAWQHVLQHKQRLVLGLTMFGAGGSGYSRGDPHYEWDRARIPDNIVRSHCNDVEYIQVLLSRTLTCSTCGGRHVIEGTVAGVQYCSCPAPTKKSSVYGEKTTGISWTPFLERKDILVWRQEHSEGSGLYAYKMYGKFDDVTPNEFLEVQLDTSEFRLSWDKNTAQLYVIEEEVNPSMGSMSQLCYWEVNWPRFFANRDYVATRRFQMFPEESVAILYSRSSQHPTCPKKTKNHRVEEYWSVLTVKPVTTWDEPGVEFSLTAFEDSGVSLPASITTWVAIRGLPEFMGNLRSACKELRKWKTKGSPRRRFWSSVEPDYMKCESKKKPTAKASAESGTDQQSSSDFVYDKLKL